MMITSLAVLFCLAAGVFLGLLGGGGSVLTVPVFVYAAGMRAEEAISLSLLVVAVTGFIGSLPYLMRGYVNRRLVVIFIFFGSIGAVAGAKLSYGVSSRILLILFGILMIGISFILFFRSPESSEAGTPECRPRLLPAALISTLLGVLTGFMGVGGGFLIVPVLALLMKCSMRASIGTSLVILSANSLAGFLGHAAVTSVPLAPAAVYTLATTGGALIGSFASSKVPAVFLRRAFSILVMGTGIFLLFKNLSA